MKIKIILYNIYGKDSINNETGSNYKIILKAEKSKQLISELLKEKTHSN